MCQRLYSSRFASLILVGAASVMIYGCNSDDPNTDSVVDINSTADSNTDSATDTDSTGDANTDSATNTDSTGDPVAVEGINFDNFLADSIVGEVAEVDCVLTDGTASRCYQFVVTGNPTDHETGPFCPRSINDGPEAGGKWLDNGSLVDLDGAFFLNLPANYGPDWVLYDQATGLVNVTDTPESCQAAAQLNPPEQWWYHCIECTIDDFGGPIEREYTVPITPVPRAAVEELDNTFPGVSLNGVGLSFPADIDGIVATFNIAALDDCAGHVNNAISYHYHGATGCWHEIDQEDQHAALIGYAMDGYGIYSMTNLDGGEPTDLDECRGHSDAERGYHYHAASPGENMFIGCFHGEIAVVEGGGGPGQGPRPQ